MIVFNQLSSPVVFRFSLLLLTLLLAASPVMAQSRVPSRTAQKPTSDQIRRFVRNFEAGVTTGCLRNLPRDQANPANYCACYARSLVGRYLPEELLAINNLAAASPENARLIALMAAPIARSCKAATGTTSSAAGGQN